MTDATVTEQTVTLEVARYRPEQDERPTFQRVEVPYRPEWGGAGCPQLPEG